MTRVRLAVFGLSLLMVLAAAVILRAPALLALAVLAPIAVAIFSRPRRGTLLVAAQR